MLSTLFLRFKSLYNTTPRQNRDTSSSRNSTSSPLAHSLKRRLDHRLQNQFRVVTLTALIRQPRPGLLIQKQIVVTVATSPQLMLHIVSTDAPSLRLSPKPKFAILLVEARTSPTQSLSPLFLEVTQRKGGGGQGQQNNRQQWQQQYYYPTLPFSMSGSLDRHLRLSLACCSQRWAVGESSLRLAFSRVWRTDLDPGVCIPLLLFPLSQRAAFAGYITNHGQPNLLPTAY